MKNIINGVLLLLVIGAGYWTFSLINTPLQFEKAFKVRKAAVVDRLTNLRIAQNTYREVNGQYAKNYSQLFKSIRNDSMATVKVVGDPNDTTVQVTYDTIYEPIMDVIQWHNGKAVDFNKLPYVPFAEGNKMFEMSADIITKQRIEIPVFEITAKKGDYLNGLNQKLASRKKDLKVGSMTEPTDAGNWE